MVLTLEDGGVLPIALTAASVVLALLLVLTAVRKLGHSEDVVASYARVGVPERALDLLAVILLAAATGVVSGLWWPIFGVITAGGLICYFLVAVVLHIRARDYRNLVNPLVFSTLAIAVTILQLAATTFE